MKYLKDEIILLQSVKIKREDVKVALNNVLEGYNRVFNMAVHQQQYIKENRSKFAKEMEENFKLVERNKFLEDEYKRYKKSYKEQADYTRKLEKEAKALKKLLIENS